MGTTTRLFFSSLSACAIVFSASGALAQASQANESVFERARPDYDAKGLPMGSFRAKPTLEVTESFNDNIFAEENNEDEDFITNVKPGLRIESDWSRHALNVYGSGDFAFYQDNDDENYEDAAGGADIRLDVLRETYLFAGASYAKKHEDRGDPNNQSSSVEPTEYYQTDANVGVYRGLRRMSVSLDGNYTELDYEDGRQSNGTINDNDGRDQEKYKGTLRVGYEILPDYEAFVRGSINNIDYDQATNNGFNRDSDGYEVEGGLALDLGGKTRGEVAIGYMSQDYDDTRLRTVDDVTFGASLLWNPTGLTSLRLNVDRTIEETVQTDAAAYINTLYGVSIEHELLRNVLLGANASFTQQQYKGNTSSREDEYINAGASAEYLLNRYASLELNYKYTDRDSSVSGQDYTSNTVLAGVGIQF